jgi:hypothetical protein
LVDGGQMVATGGFILKIVGCQAGREVSPRMGITMS